MCFSVFLLGANIAVSNMLFPVPKNAIPLPGNGGFWADCSDEVLKPLVVPEDLNNSTASDVQGKIEFTKISSDPVIWTPHSSHRQIVTKEMRYVPRSDVEGAESGKPKKMRQISATMHQFYKIGDKFWMTFLYLPKTDQCKEHDKDQLCPLPDETREGEDVTKAHRTLKTIHPKLGKYTPFGVYRSRQVWTDVESGVVVGCADMGFEYREEAPPGLDAEIDSGLFSQLQDWWSTAAEGSESENKEEGSEQIVV